MSSSLFTKRMKLARENFLDLKIFLPCTFISPPASDTGFFNKVHAAEQVRKEEQQETGTSTNTHNTQVALR